MKTLSDNKVDVFNLRSVLPLQVALPPQVPPESPLVLDGLVHQDDPDHLVHPGITQLRVIVVSKFITLF